MNLYVTVVYHYAFFVVICFVKFYLKYRLSRFLIKGVFLFLICFESGC